MLLAAKYRLAKFFGFRSGIRPLSLELRVVLTHRCQPLVHRHDGEHI